MSESSNVIDQPVVGGDNGGDLQWDDAPQAAEPVQATPQPDPAPVQTEPVTVEPASPAPLPAPSESDFTISTLQNGQKELRLETGQVYRGKDDGEIIAQLAKAQREASKRIRDLSQTAPPAQGQVQPQTQTQSAPVEPQYDPATVALADLLAPMFGVKNGQELVQSYRAMQEQIQSYQPLVQQTQMNTVAADFVRSTNDFEITPRNSELLGETMDKLGLPLTVDNMKFAHYALKGQGLYETTKPPIATEMFATPRTPTGQFAPRSMPLPPAPSTATPPAPVDIWDDSKLFA